MPAPQTKTETRSIELASWGCMLLKERPQFDVFFVTGGLGAAKSTNGLLTFLIHIMDADHRKCPNWWVIAPTYTQINNALIPACTMLLQEYFGFKLDSDFSLNRSPPPEITLPTGQKIEFHSGDRPEKMVSTTIGGAFISEAGLLSRTVFEKVGDRVRDKKAKYPIMIIEGTPEGTGNWYYEEANFEKVNHEKKYRRYVVHTDDNIQHLAPGYIERMERRYAHDENRLLSYRFGQFVDFKRGNAFTQYVESRNLIEMEPDPNVPIALCYDFNVTPLCWSAWQTRTIEVDGKRHQAEVCVAESSLEIDNLFNSAAEFGSIIDPDIFKYTPIEIWGDRTGHAKSHKSSGSDFSNLRKWLAQEFQNVTVKAPKGVTPIRARIDVCNALFLYQRAMVGSGCVNIRRSFSNTRWKEGKADLDKPAGETVTHHSDGAGYRLYWLYKDFDFTRLTVPPKVIGHTP